MELLDLPAWFVAKIEVKPTGCWEWIGYKVDGYGRTKGMGAYRYAYLQLVGSIPDGLVMDHLCNNPPCCNPAHLEAVTQSENVKRGYARAGGRHWRHKSNACKAGHEYTEANTRIRKHDGARLCRKCQRDYQNSWNAERRSQPVVG